MKNIITPFLAVLTVSLLVPQQASSEPSDELFDYTRTMAIYHMVDGGGHIYVRPRGYNPRHGFIMIYEALDQYIVELANPENRRFITPEESSLIDEFVLVNDTAQKRFFLKNYWLGDGENWVPMSRDDYDRLRKIIDGRREAGSIPTPEGGLKETTKEIYARSLHDDYSGYEWEGENVRQYPPWTSGTDTHTEADSPKAASNEKDVETLADSAAEKTATPQDTAPTEDTPPSGNQTNIRQADHPTNQIQPVIKNRGNDPIRLNSAGDAPKTEKQAEASNRPLVRIAVLFALIAGVFLYTRRKS